MIHTIHWESRAGHEEHDNVLSQTKLNEHPSRSAKTNASPKSSPAIAITQLGRHGRYRKFNLINTIHWERRYRRVDLLTRSITSGWA